MKTKLLILRPRNMGYRFVCFPHLRTFADFGLWEFKQRYNLNSLPWWLQPEGAPITNPRRLLTDGKEHHD